MGWKKSKINEFLFNDTATTENKRGEDTLSLHDALPIYLFGDTNAVHISVYNDHYEIDQVYEGETVADVLDYVDYNPRRLVRNVESWATKAMKEGKVTPEEGREFLSNYRSGLYGYTYLERD